MLLQFEAEAKSLRLRPEGPEAKREARGYEAEAKILASRQFCLEPLTFWLQPRSAWYCSVLEKGYDIALTRQFVL